MIGLPRGLQLGSRVLGMCSPEFEVETAGRDCVKRQNLGLSPGVAFF